MYCRKISFLGSLLLATIAFSILPTIGVAQTGPCLEVSHDSLIFHGDYCDGVVTPTEADSLSFAVMNCGDDSLVWFASGYRPWIGFTPASGVDFDSVYVWINWDQLPFTPDTLLPGDSVYLSGVVWVTAPDATPDTLHGVKIGLWVRCSDTGDPHLLVQPSNFSFTLDVGASASGNLSVTESHNDTVLIDVVSFSNWLTVPQFFAPIYTPSTIEFGVNTTGLNPGSYTGVILVTAYDSTTGTALDTATVMVALTVTDSVLYTIQASPDLFTYHLQPGDSVIGESVYVSEAGGASINFWTYNQQNWLYVDTMAASPLFTPETIAFDIRTDGLTAGFYSDSIFIWGDSAGPHPFLVPIQVFLGDTASTYSLATQPTSMSFVVEQGLTEYDSLFVYEVSGAPVNFVHSHQSSWLAVDPFGMYPYQTPASLIIVVTAAHLSPGVYADTIHIFTDSSGGNAFAPIAVPVDLEVTPTSPQIIVVPPYVSLFLDTGVTLSSYVIAYDQSGANYEFAVQADPGSTWLQILTATGTTPDSITFSISTTGMAYGAYSDTLVIYNPLDAPSPYFERRVPVNLYVAPDSGSSSYAVRASPPSLQWRFPPHTGTHSYVQVYEQWGRTGLFHFTQSAPWFSAWVFGQSGPSYTFPCSLVVVSTDSMMTPGFYHDTLWIWPDTDGVSFAPVAIAISLEALPDEPIMAIPNHFEFTAHPGDSIVGSSFVVHSPGTTILTYDIFLKNASSWIEWVYPSGQLTVLPTTIDTIRFDIISTGLAEGSYVDTFVIFNPLDSGAGYFEIAVPITLTLGNASASAICGDVNNDGIGPDISDLTFMVAYMFLEGPPPPMMEQVKFTGSGGIDITDLTAMVDFMFRYGPLLTCPLD